MCGWEVGGTGAVYENHLFTLIRSPLLAQPSRRLLRVSGGPIALEIFSGSGHFSKAWRLNPRLKGVPIYEWDILHGEAFDLTKRRQQRFIRGLIRSGKVVAVWMGTPCSSWSMIRSVGAGPPNTGSGSRAAPARAAAGGWPKTCTDGRRHRP